MYGFLFPHIKDLIRSRLPFIKTYFRRIVLSDAVYEELKKLEEQDRVKDLITVLQQGELKYVLERYKYAHNLYFLEGVFIHEHFFVFFRARLYFIKEEETLSLQFLKLVKNNEIIKIIASTELS